MRSISSRAWASNIATYCATDKLRLPAAKPATTDESSGVAFYLAVDE